MLNSDRANRIFFFKQMGRFGPVSLLLQSCTLCIVQPPQSLPDPNLTISLFRAWRENQENRFFPGPWSPLAPLAQCEAASESSFAVKLGGQLWGGQGTRMTTSGRIRGTHLYSIQASPPGVAENAVVPNGRTAREQEETGDRQDDPCPQPMAGEHSLSNESSSARRPNLEQNLASVGHFCCQYWPVPMLARVRLVERRQRMPS